MQHDPMRKLIYYQYISVPKNNDMCTTVHVYRISITFSIRKAQIRTESNNIEIKIPRMPMNSSYILFHDSEVLPYQIQVWCVCSSSWGTCCLKHPSVLLIKGIALSDKRTINHLKKITKSNTVHTTTNGRAMYTHDINLSIWSASATCILKSLEL